MRKMIFLALMAATAIPGLASAQNAELRHDRQDVREERRDLRDAVRHGDRDDVRDARGDLRDARRETREDWRDYRRDHRDAYRMQRYVGPRGYSYRQLVIGHRLDRSYFGQRYIVANPWRYRLAATHGMERWVRYGNDVVLVNMRTGRIIEINRDFFW